MKRLTPRYKNWMMHRQRYVAKQRRAVSNRLSRTTSTQGLVRLYARVKGLTQQLAYRDSFYVIWAYSQYLQISDFEIPSDIEVAPRFLATAPPQALLAEWTLEQIAGEVIQCAGETPQDGRSLRQWATLALIANTLRDIEGELYARLVGGRNIHLELMRISHRQFIWQQHSLWRSIIRYYKLFNTPEINAQSEQATRLTIDQIYLIGMSYLGIFFGQPFAVYKIKVEIPGVTQTHVDHFLRVVSLSLPGLRNRLRAEHSLDEGFAYRYSSLREFPLVRISQGDVAEIACPIPTLLFWRITTGLYYSLKDEKGFSTAFGHSFENYVGEVLRSRMTKDTMRVLGEAEYLVGKDRKDTVDWIVQQGETDALFIECKTKRLTWASKSTIADLTALEQDIRKLAGAVVQVYRTIKDYREDRYPQLPFSVGRRIYPLIVTLEDWYFFGHTLPVRLDASVREIMARAALPVDWLVEMPYSIMSVDEFETTTGVIHTIGIHPFISGKVLDPERRLWAYGAYCNDRYPKKVNDLPKLFEEQYEAMFANLVAQGGT